MVPYHNCHFKFFFHSFLFLKIYIQSVGILLVSEQTQLGPLP